MASRLTSTLKQQLTAREKDVKTVVAVAEVLSVIVNRSHRMFPKFSPDPLHQLASIKQRKNEHMDG